MVWAAEDLFAVDRDSDAIGDLPAVHIRHSINAECVDDPIPYFDLFNMLPASRCIDHRARRKALIEHDADECSRIESVQTFVVGDADAGLDVRLLPADRDRDAELLALASGLRGHGQRGQDHDVAAGVLVNEPRPVQLHRGLPETTITQEGGPATFHRPADDV